MENRNTLFLFVLWTPLKWILNNCLVPLLIYIPGYDLRWPLYQFGIESWAETEPTQGRMIDREGLLAAGPKWPNNVTDVGI